jgi:hypothetical protein
LLNQILATGWQPGEQDADEVEAEIDETLSRLFSIPVAGVSVDEAREIMAQTPPFRQIAERFSSLNIEREIGTYQALHLFFDGLALVAESLIDRQGKQGELIAYDAMLYGLRQRSMHQMEASEYLARRLERFTFPSDTQDIFSAGLEVETMPGSENEVVTLVKECEWARYYQERHPEVGYLLACSLDNAAYQAINPSLYLQRTSTLMEGGRFCDFRVYAFVDDDSEVVV